MTHHAEQVFAVCGNDGSNVEIAVHVYELHKALPVEKRARVECWLHVVDPMLCEALKSHGMFRDATDSFVVGVTNIFENSARLLLQEHPLDREFIGAGDPRAVHLVIVGFGQMGQSIALQAAKIGQFANGRKLQQTILDRDADRQERRFLARYPQFTKVCDLRFIHSDFEVGDFFRQLQQWAKSADNLLSIAICLDNDSASLRCALTLAAQLERTTVPLFVRMEEDVGLASLLNCQAQTTELLRHVHAFGQINLAASLSKWISAGQDDIAMSIHEGFRIQRAAEVRPSSDPSMRNWNDLSEGLKNSNRQFADHMPVKLRAIRCVVDKPREGENAVKGFTQVEADLLAKMEHARWNAERFLGNWQLGPADKPNKISPYLVEWDVLPKEIQKYDYEMVEVIPQLVNSMNQQIYRVDASPSMNNPSSAKSKQ